MPRFSKRDFIFCLVTGLITGFSAWRIFTYLRPGLFGHPIWGLALMIGIPILWIVGVNLGYFLGRWFPFFSQFGKFSAIGFTNGAVDFGVLNLLIASTGYASGWHYSLFKGVSFLAAVIPSYFWNKYWAFDASRPAADIVAVIDGPSEPAGKASGNFGSGTLGTGTLEFTKFMTVAVVSTFVNNGTASLVVNYIHPLLGLSPQVWANIGAAAGSAAALIFSFVGFKLAVFKK